jgi:hypothetical protein
MNPQPRTKKISISSRSNVQNNFLLIVLTLTLSLLLFLLVINTMQYEPALSQRPFLVYQNPTYKFTIEYPSNWERLDFSPGIEEEGRNIIVNFLSPVLSSIPTFREYLIVEVGNLTSVQNLSLAQYTTKQINSRKSIPNFQLIESTPTHLSGRYQANKIVYKYSSPIVGTVEAFDIITINANKIYYLSYNAGATKYLSYFPQAQKMVDSFRIIR